MGPRVAEADAAGGRGSDEPEGFSLPRSSRITGPTEIRALFRRGKRRKTRHLDVFVSPSPEPFPRLGLVVPRHRRNAVQRNRLKRRLREIGRTALLPRLRRADRQTDLLVRARPEAYAASYEALLAELVEVVERVCSHGS